MYATVVTNGNGEVLRKISWVALPRFTAPGLSVHELTGSAKKFGAGFDPVLPCNTMDHKKYFDVTREVLRRFNAQGFQNKFVELATTFRSTSYNSFGLSVLKELSLHG